MNNEIIPNHVNDILFIGNNGKKVNCDANINIIKITIKYNLFTFFVVIPANPLIKINGKNGSRYLPSGLPESQLKKLSYNINPTLCFESIPKKTTKVKEKIIK